MAEGRDEVEQCGRELGEADAAHDVVEADEELGVVEVVVKEALGDETRDQRGDAIDRPRGEVANGVLCERGVELGKSGVIIVEAGWIVFGKRAVEEKLDENVAEKAGAKTFVAGQHFADFDGELQA